MKTLSTLALALLSCALPCRAQSLAEELPGMGHAHRLCSHATTPAAVAAVGKPSAIVRRPYDVLSYDVEIDWRSPLSTTSTIGVARQYKAINTMRVRIDSANVGSIALDSRSQRIDRVLLDGSEVAISQPADGILTIPFATAPEQGQELTIRIEYTYIGTDNTGFHLYAKGSQSGAVVERIAYTLGAPDYARYWLPCNDNAYDKATARFTVVVPKAYTVASNGLPTPPVDNGDGSATYVWSDTAQIATYLMVVHASIYHSFSDEYERQDGVKIPLLYYVWEPDYEGDTFNAKEKFAPVPDMMQHFAAHYGEYPFSKYGMAIAMPFTYFAMENQTMTTLVRAAINDEPTIAHELSHQWLGDLVSPATWNDVWMNEGGATYSEALWAEATNAEEYRKTLADKRDIYLAENSDGTKQPPCYRDIDKSPISGNIYNYAITYSKGAWVYHILRRLVGDDVFFPMLRSFLQEHAFSYAETEDMIASFEQYLEAHSVVPPISMRTFFDEWVYQKGHPIYTATAAVGQNGDKFTATVLLGQTQTTQVFTMPVDIGFTGANNEYAVRTIFLDKSEKSETFELPFLPVSIAVDPDEKILRVVKSAVVTDVFEELGNPLLLQVYPNPAVDGIAHIHLALPAAAVGIMEVYNAMGERVAVLHEGMYSAGPHLATWNTAGLPAGTYMVRLNTGTQSIYCKVCIGR